MGLEDFEKELAASKAKEQHSASSHRHREHSRDRDRKHRRHHHHHHRSHRHRHDEPGREKRRREDGDRSEHRKRRRRRSHSSTGEPSQQKEEVVKVFDSDGGEDEDEDEWAEKEAPAPAPVVQRDSWMQQPSALDVEVVKSRKPEAPKGQFVSAKESNEFQVQQEKRTHLADLQRDFDSDGEAGGEDERVEQDLPAQHKVSYEFGDSGSAWRMTKLMNVYRQAEESKRPVDDVALERYGDLRAFDDAREEERELDRRNMYGNDYVGNVKPSGELYQERKMKNNDSQSSVDTLLKQSSKTSARTTDDFEEAAPPKVTVPLDSSALNRLKAQMMKAKLRNAPEAARLEAEYNAATEAASANHVQSDVIVLNNMENRQLAGDRSGEVTALGGKRARERRLVEENEDMSIEDMVRNEKRSRGTFGGEGRNLAERIAKDSKFEDDLEYMDDNATKLSKRVVKSETNLRNTAIGDFQKMQRILESCPLCYRDESNQHPAAPVVSLGTRTYLTLQTEPELARYGAVIVPIQHRLNLLECDDDEWEEMRNFMKSLTRFYDSIDKSVLFYENAAHMHSRKGHAALMAVPVAHHLAENGPAYFREAILASDEQWSQHKPVIDTMALTQKPGYGKQAFRKSMAKEMPYFHVWFTLDGGMGHVVEDERKWPKGDLFAREVLGSMLGHGPEFVKKQGRWERGDRRVDSFRKRWSDYDWTKALME